MTTSYWCYRCNHIIRVLNQDTVTCPDCRSGFVEEIDNNSAAAREIHVVSERLNPEALLTNHTPGNAVIRRSHHGGGNRSSFNPIIVLRGGAAASVATSSVSADNSSVEVQNGRGFELYYDDGVGSGLRPLPAGISEFLLGSGLDRLIDQLSQMEIGNGGRNELAPASKAAVEAMPTVEITETHIHDELCCAVCKDQFELGTKVKNMPCDHLYHSNCILPWLQLRNSCPVCRHELSASDCVEGAEAGSGYLNPSEDVPVGLTIWRLPGGGFAVGRFSGSISGGGGGESRYFPMVYTEVDGGLGGGGLPRWVTWGGAGHRGRERVGFFRRVFGNFFGCFSGSNSSNSRLISR